MKRHEEIVARHAGETHRNFEAYREMQIELALYRRQTQEAEVQARTEHQTLLTQARSAEAYKVYQTCCGREFFALQQIDKSVLQKNLAWEQRVETTERRQQAELRDHECHNAEGLQSRSREQTNIH